MQFGNYANIVQIAAALSMAGWVARTPENSQEYPLNLNNQQINSPSSRFHPYGQPSPNNWAENFNNQNYGPMVQHQPALPNNFNSFGRNELYESKDAEETFRAYMELQELISWQESYRRGDLPVGQPMSEQFVMPITNQQGKSREQTSTDDGYVSAIGSPASSTVSALSNEIDEISTTSSPSPSDSVFDNLDFHAQTPFSHASDQQNNFDIDEILNCDDKDYLSVNKLSDTNEKESVKVPFSKLLSSLDEGLDYVADSPLKSPGTDSFLSRLSPSRLSPEYNPPNYTTNKFDPFQMKFTNASMPDKLLADTLEDIADFDPSFFENSEKTDEEMDKALVQSLSKSNGVSVKTEDDFSNIGSPLVEHDYSREEFLSSKQSQVGVGQAAPRFNEYPQTKNNVARQQRAPVSSVPRRLTGRTFAPSSPKPLSTKTKVKKEKDEPKLWEDFPYSTDEVISMPVEKFNEVIKQLDEIRQHVAKDVRRKGKNKLAARNCRKRKMDVIDHLDTGINHLEYQRTRLMAERKSLLDETRKLHQKTEWLDRYILEHLRDDNGMPYSSNDYSLQYTADGNVYLVPANQV